ncbi:MAG: protease inhibitor I42 family protein [Mediterranea sp.]|jgi:predicted secreted protein|nr:protease inhibitor I42 family protein [Mediterranea sp.]
MFRKAFKVGETFTLQRTYNSGTNNRYALSSLCGGIVLVEEKAEAVPHPEGFTGFPVVQSFTFLCVQPGKAEVQLAQLRGTEVLYEDVLPYVVAPAAGDNANAAIGQTLGGWSDFAPLSEDDTKVFGSALKGLVGVDYTPVLVSYQIVDGKQYRFFCISKTVTAVPKYGTAMITVYVPNGESTPVLESIVTYA